MVVSGSPAAAAWASSSDRRTACMATRSAAALIVVSRPTTSYSSDRRSRCSAQALSLPLLQESTTGFMPRQLLSARALGGTRVVRQSVAQHPHCKVRDKEELHATQKRRWQDAPRTLTGAQRSSDKHIDEE